MFELLMFDLDGTLVDSRADIALSVNLTLGELGLPEREPEHVYGHIGSGVHKLILNCLPQGRGDLLERGVDVFWANYKEHVLDTTVPYPGVYKMLETLSGRKMAVVTNKPYAHTHMIITGLDIDRYFMSVQGWKQGLKVKPDPELVVRALTETGTAPERAVMIGDGMNDILAARAAGVKVVAVGYGYGSPDKMAEAGPDFFARSVSDIAGIIG